MKRGGYVTNSARHAHVVVIPNDVINIKVSICHPIILGVMYVNFHTCALNARPGNVIKNIRVRHTLFHNHHLIKIIEKFEVS